MRRAAAVFGKRIGVLPDQARKLGERIIGGRRIGPATLGGLMIAVSLRFWLSAIEKPPVQASRSIRNGAERLRTFRDHALAHFVRRLDPQQRQPRGQHRHNSRNQGQTRPCRFWIILDNEA